MDDFWAFSLRVYTVAGVPQRLLDWQESAGANVNLALACIWAAERGRSLRAPDLRRAQTGLAGWHTATVAPLRALRRRLKADWAGLAIDAEPARQAVLAAELEAERAEQALIVRALAPWPATPHARPNPALAAANLRTYLGSAAGADIRALLAAIA